MVYMLLYICLDLHLPMKTLPIITMQGCLNSIKGPPHAKQCTGDGTANLVSDSHSWSGVLGTILYNNVSQLLTEDL